MVTIRPEQRDDSQAVYEVNKLAFGQENEAKLVELLSGKLSIGTDGGREF